MMLWKTVIMCMDWGTLVAKTWNWKWKGFFKIITRWQRNTFQYQWFSLLEINENEWKFRSPHFNKFMPFVGAFLPITTEMLSEKCKEKGSKEKWICLIWVCRRSNALNSSRVCLLFFLLEFHFSISIFSIIHVFI